MPTAAISQSSPQPQHEFFLHRNAELKQLGQALQSGNLADAQSAYQAIVQLGQKGPFPNSDPFLRANREQAFEAIGTALQNGDLQGAKQAMHTLVQSFRDQSPFPMPWPGLHPKPPVKGPDLTPEQVTGVNVVG